jgi:cyclopropane-fatty-acyl-phospholipid synthase
MYGDINLDPPSLLPIFKLFILNREALASLSSGPVAKYLVAYPQAYLTNSRFVNSLANSRSNISAHYDISNEMFEAFLSEDMTYSCAIFENLDEDVKLERKLDGAVSELNTGLGLKSIRDLRTLPSGVADSGTPASPSSGGFSSDSESENAEGTGTSTPVTSIPSTPRTSSVCPEYEADSQREDPLYEAQMRKLRHIIKKADIRKGHRVLEIGSGALGFSIELSYVHQLN